MKVLIVYPDFYVYGGGETLVVRLCNYLTKKNVHNAILTMSMLPEVRNDLINTDVCLFGRRHSSIGTLRSMCGEVKRLSLQYDVVNLHNYPAEIAATSSKKPTVWMCNEPELHLSLAYNKLRFKTKAYLKALSPYEKYIVRNRMDYNVVADEFNAKRFEMIYGRTPTIIRYGIDTEYFVQGDRTDARNKLKLGEQFVVLHVGMLTPLKNQMESLRAVKKLKNVIKNVRLVLAGYWHEDYKREIDEYIKANDLQSCVTMTGHVSRRDLRDWYHAADVLIHPIGSQGGWLSPFEAVCAGTPIVVSPEMTASAIIGEKDLGEVSSDYCKSLLNVYNNKNYYRNKTADAASWVRNNLTWDEFGKRMLDTFCLAAGSSR